MDSCRAPARALARIFHTRAGARSVAQTSKSAVSRVSKPACRPLLAAVADTLRISKSAIRQVWKPALRAGLNRRHFVCEICGLVRSNSASQNHNNHAEAVTGRMKDEQTPRSVLVAKMTSAPQAGASVAMWWREAPSFWPVRMLTRLDESVPTIKGLGNRTVWFAESGGAIWSTARATMISLAETPLTGESDAGNPPVRSGRRSNVQSLVPVLWIRVSGALCALRVKIKANDINSSSLMRRTRRATELDAA